LRNVLTAAPQRQPHTAQQNYHRKAFQRIPRLGVVQRQQQHEPQRRKPHHRRGQRAISTPSALAPQPQTHASQRQIHSVQRRIGHLRKRTLRMRLHVPPGDRHLHQLGARPQPHVQVPRQRQQQVVAQRMRLHALVCKPPEPRVDGRRDVRLHVVLRIQRARRSHLRCIVERARRQIFQAQHVAVIVPVHIHGRLEVDRPRAVPALKPEQHKLSRLVRIARGQRLKDVHRVFVAHAPGQQRQHHDDRRNRRRPQPRNPPAPA
jgi:hypothetical protein